MPDLAELFARNPLDLTREDISQIVEELRKSRHAFNAGNLRAGAMKETPKAKALKSIADAMDLKIDL